MSFVYILHFETPLSHARHYAGCTDQLRARLTAHANGAGSRLCRELLSQGIEWQLGGLFTCNKSAMRRMERKLKDMKNGPRYCEICSVNATALPETTYYSPTLLTFPANSKALRTVDATVQTLISTGFVPPCGQIEVQKVTRDSSKTTMKAIRAMMDADKDALGFIPCGGDGGIGKLVDTGKLIVVKNNADIVGYLAYSLLGERITIQQACVRDDARLMGHGQAMIEYVARAMPNCALWCKVRDDLAANHFWPSVGFDFLRASEHGTSRNILNHYFRKPFSHSQEEKCQDTSTKETEPTPLTTTDSEPCSPTSSPPS